MAAQLDDHWKTKLKRTVCPPQESKKRISRIIFYPNFERNDKKLTAVAPRDKRRTFSFETFDTCGFGAERKKRNYNTPI